jgi:hypothetical protein
MDKAAVATSPFLGGEVRCNPPFCFRVFCFHCLLPQASIQLLAHCHSCPSRMQLTLALPMPPAFINNALEGARQALSEMLMKYVAPRSLALPGDD